MTQWFKGVEAAEDSMSSLMNLNIIFLRGKMFYKNLQRTKNHAPGTDYEALSDTNRKLKKNDKIIKIWEIYKKNYKFIFLYNKMKYCKNCSIPHPNSNPVLE